VDSIKLAVSILTAIMSEQDEIANQIIDENEPIDVITALVGMSFSSLCTLSALTQVPVEAYLQRYGDIAQSLS